MKKLLSLILASALVLTLAFTLVSCGKKDEKENDDTPTGDTTPLDIYALFAQKQPTRTVTHITYNNSNGDILIGHYDLQINGQNAIFEFSYDRYRTSQEAIEDNDSDKIKTVTGKIYTKDGTYSTDGVVWGSSPVATSIKLTIAPELLKVANVSTDGLSLTALVAAENAEAVFGTKLSADENGILLTLQSNGTYVTLLTATYSTTEGAQVSMQTSFSYNTLSLAFPE